MTAPRPMRVSTANREVARISESRSGDKQTLRSGRTAHDAECAHDENRIESHSGSRRNSRIGYR